MRKLILLLVATFALAGACQAQTKITALPSATPAATDVIPFVADPSGTPTTKKAPVSDFFSVLTPSFIPSANKNGSGSKFQLFTGSSSTNDCAKFDSSGNIVTNGGTCAAAAPVQSVFGRVGAVLPATNDYNFNQIAGSISTSQQPSTTVNSVVNDTNIQGSISSQVLTFSWASTLSKARQHAATVYNDQANTFGAFLQDLTAGSFKAPNSAGAAPTTSALFAYDTTANRFVGGVNGATKKFLFPDSTDTLTNKTIDGGSNTLTNIGNSSLVNNSITIQGSAVPLGGSALATNSTPQFLRLGLNQAADASAPLGVTGAANNITLFQLKRSTDTSPTGNFVDFQSAAAASIWKMDITGTLIAGTVPVARVSGLASVATSGSASDLSAGTLPAARIHLYAAHVYNSADETLATATDTALTFDSEREDTDAFHSTSSNTSRLVAPVAGRYVLTVTVRFASNSTGYRMVYFKINGTTFIPGVQTANAISGAVTTLTASASYRFAANDYVEVYAFQNSGGNLAVVATGNISPEVTMQYVGN